MSLISFVTRIHFADRVLEDALPEEMEKLGIRRPLVVTDEAGERDDCLDRLLDSLPPLCDPVHLNGFSAKVMTGQVRAVSQACSENRCDGVIGFGGAVALDISRLIDARSQLITIPTTTESVGLGPIGAAFAGREICNPRSPSVVLCDATLTMGASAYSTAIAGMDTLTHCLEAYLGTAFNPPADGIALEGLRRAMRHLSRAVENGDDLEARREMLAAALNAGLAARKGLGGIDAAAKAVEAQAGLWGRHGALNAALVPHVLAFNTPAVTVRLPVIREALGVPPDGDAAFVIAELGVRLGLPDRIGSLGLGRADLRKAAEAAAADPANQTNPRLATADDYFRLLQEAC
ncbi:alcohol dehydrogenase class IV [Hoeflea halophila]|uniref:Alcohol dehydrogenase class IV n=1 Tax=Hoeflea halophila TaxID=714899 RepID=A0A286IB11_9HYPH|nr:iron-containing alcohol dehydrogenase [Hoeflea halophila]SOE17252.1 alcohol dehydrogenase class IV [Hoeflea halophila]